MIRVTGVVVIVGDQSKTALERLRAAIDSKNWEIEKALEEAEEELTVYRDYWAELEELIARAHTILNPPRSELRHQDLRTVGQVALHEEMADILTEHGNKGMRARELAVAVNTRGRYVKRDGSPVEINQIHARVHNNPPLFRREDFKIYLRDVS